MSLSSFVSLSFPSKRRKGKTELSKGRHELGTVLDALMASKGDTILVIPRWFVILVNMPWEKFIEGMVVLDRKAQRVVDVRFVVDVFKVNEARRYALARLVEGRVVAEFVRSEIKEEETEDSGVLKEIEGVEFRAVDVWRRRYQVSGKATLHLDPNGWRIYEEVESSKFMSAWKETRIRWRVVGDGRLAGILRKYMEMAGKPMSFSGSAVLFTEDGIASVRADDSGNIEVSVSDAGLPPREKMVEVSRFYDIIVPQLITDDMVGMKERNVRRIHAKFMVYHGGRAWSLVLNNEPPDTIWFRILRSRSASTYIKKILPRGYESVRDIIKKVGVPEWRFFFEVFRNADSKAVTAVVREFSRFLDEVHERIRNLRAKPRNIDGVEGFFEAIYARVPKRKLKVIRQWMELYEKVKGLAPSTALYVVFYGRRVFGRRYRPNFVGFRVGSDSRVAVLSNRVVPISGIAFRGGAFESAYRDVMNLDNLIFYQLARREEKLAILRDWVEEVRGRLVSSGVAPATATFKEVAKKIAEVAESEDLTDNGVLLVFRFLRSMRERASQDVLAKVEGLAKYLVGLVKSGRYPDDYVKFAERGFLEPMRWVVKWAIKSRGYSIRKGVLILGDPIEVRRRVREVIQRMRGRLLALAESLDLEVVSGEAREYVETSRRRLEALLKVI